MIDPNAWDMIHKLEQIIDHLEVEVANLKLRVEDLEQRKGETVDDGQDVPVL